MFSQHLAVDAMLSPAGIFERDAARSLHSLSTSGSYSADKSSDVSSSLSRCAAVRIRTDGEGAAPDGSNRQIHGRPCGPAAHRFDPAALPRPIFAPGDRSRSSLHARRTTSAPSRTYFIACTERPRSLRTLVFPTLEDLIQAAVREPTDRRLPVDFARSSRSPGVRSPSRSSIAQGRALPPPRRFSRDTDRAYRFRPFRPRRTSRLRGSERAPLEPTDFGFPINLATALRLSDARPLIVAAAQASVWVAEAQLTRAKVIWIPTMVLGADYIRHDGGGPDFNKGVMTAPSVNFFYAGGGMDVELPHGVCEPDRRLLRAAGRSAGPQFPAMGHPDRQKRRPASDSRRLLSRSSVSGHVYRRLYCVRARSRPGRANRELERRVG